MAQLIRAAAPIWRLSIILSSILGGLLLIGGIILAYFGISAETTFNLFGNQFSSTNVGISLVFIGVVLIILVIRRTLSSLDKVTTGTAESADGGINKRAQ